MRPIPEPKFVLGRPIRVSRSLSLTSSSNKSDLVLDIEELRDLEVSIAVSGSFRHVG
jgi:hypothetical protein